MAVGASGTILTSSDGSTWTSRISGTSQSLRGITYGNSQFVTVGVGGVGLASLNLTTWNSFTTEISQSGVNFQGMGITFGENQFIAVSFYSNILSTIDGTNWTVTHSNKSFDLYGITLDCNSR